MNLIPFNLSRALYGDPVVTREGRKVLEIHCMAKDVKHPVIAIIEDYGDSMQFTKSGMVIHNTEVYDLFMAPKTEKRWVNLYYTNGYITTSIIYKSKEDATFTEDYPSNYLETIEVEIPCD